MFKVPLDISPERLLRYWIAYIAKQKGKVNKLVSDDKITEMMKRFQGAIMKLEDNIPNKLHGK